MYPKSPLLYFTWYSKGTHLFNDARAGFGHKRHVVPFLSFFSLVTFLGLFQSDVLFGDTISEHFFYKLRSNIGLFFKEAGNCVCIQMYSGTAMHFSANYYTQSKMNVLLLKGCTVHREHCAKRSLQKRTTKEKLDDDDTIFFCFSMFQEASEE